MNYQGTLIAVKDIKRATAFYLSVFGLEVLADAGVHVQLAGGIFLQTTDSWAEIIHKQELDIILENNASELYFESEDIDSFIELLEAREDIVYLHSIVEQDWGQRAVRFYDPDKHIIEVAEKISKVVERFIDSGLTVEETAERTGVEP